MSKRRVCPLCDTKYRRDPEVGLIRTCHNPDCGLYGITGDTSTRVFDRMAHTYDLTFRGTPPPKAPLNTGHTEVQDG